MDFVATDQPLLITTAVTTVGLENLVPTLNAWLSVREQSQKLTYIVPCENIVGPGFHELTQAYDASQYVFFLSCIVDRVCGQPTMEGEDLTVLVERMATWVIERKGDVRELEGRLSRAGVEFVDNLKPFELRKRWLVNGPHLAASLIGWQYGVAFLDEFLSGEEGRLFIEGVLAECVEALLAKTNEFQQDTLVEFARSVKERFESHPDHIARILSKLRPESLQLFINAVRVRLVDPSAEYAQHKGTAPHFLTTSIHAAIALIADQRWVPARIS